MPEYNSELIINYQNVFQENSLQPLHSSSHGYCSLLTL
jgi:cytochrome oxidase assembly protein ShyY1